MRKRVLGEMMQHAFLVCFFAPFKHASICHSVVFCCKYVSLCTDVWSTADYLIKHFAMRRRLLIDSMPA